MRPYAHPEAADLLRTEHAVVRVLATAAGETEAYPGLLAAIGESLNCAGALWLPDEEGGFRCAETWPAGAAAGASLVADAWRSPTAIPGAFAFPLPGVGVMAFATAARFEPDADLLATMESLGTQISHFVERCRAQHAVRASDARKSAILNAAFDCIVTMDHEGRVIEVNRAAERAFGYSASEMIGHELAELIIPPALRELHRAGLRRYLRTGVSRIGGRRLEALAMRADGSEFPIELIVTRPDVPDPAMFCGYLRDMTEPRAREREERRLVAEQAALRRVATAVAAESDPRRVFGVVTEEVARLLLAQSSNMVRFNDDVTATVVGGWSEGEVRNVPVGDTVRIDGDTASGVVYRTAAPARIDSYAALDGDLAEHLHGLGFQCAVAAPIFLDGRLWGAVIVSSVDPTPFPEGAEQRIADFAELAAQALANANAREELAASRARIVAAGDAERRRLERNLHDGAQQRLVSLALMLRMAARRHPGRRRLSAGGRGAGARAAGAARARPRHPSGGAHRAGARARGHVAGHARAAAGRGGDRSRRSASRPGRGGGVLHGLRGADQRGEVRACVRGHGGRRAVERARADRDPRRRDRRRGGRGRVGTARARGPRRGARRALRAEQPGGGGNDAARRNPLLRIASAES